MIGLTCGPFEIGVMVVMAVSVDVEDVREVVGVRHECFSHETMHLEVLSLNADAAVAFTVEGGYFAIFPAGRKSGHTISRRNGSGIPSGGTAGNTGSNGGGKGGKRSPRTGREDTAIIGDEICRVTFLPELEDFNVTSHTLLELNHRRYGDKTAYQ